MALGDLLSGILGGDAGKEDMKEGLALSREAADALKNVYVPTVEEQKILLQNPELAELLKAEQLNNSQMENVNVDPRLRNAQMSALEDLAGLSKTGLGVEDQSAFNSLRRQIAAEAQAQNQSVLQNAAATGTLNSGNTLMAQLNAGQQSANRGAEQADRLAGNAAEARRAALAQYGNMASQVGQQDFSQKSQIAQAQDAISKFNTQNRQDVNQYNVTNKQNLENQRAANANQQEMYNKGLIQQKFQNQMGKATGQAGATQNLANMYSQQGQAAAQGQANMTSGLLNTAAGLGAAYMTAGASEGVKAAAPAAATGAADLYQGPKRNRYNV
jgi:hypothetical protein